MQSRADSFMEVLTNIVIGLLFSAVANPIILPLVFGVEVTLAANLLTGALYTAVSLFRQYVIRRLFNGRSPWAWLKSEWRWRKLYREWVRQDTARIYERARMVNGF